MPDFSLEDLGRFLKGAGKLFLPAHLRAQLEGTFELDRADVLENWPTQMPALHAIAHEAADRPFANLRVVMVLHYLRDFLYFVGACERLGLEPQRTLLLYKPYPYAEKEWVRRCLEHWGYATAPVEELPNALPRFLAQGNERVLVIEDGGYVVPLLHQGLVAELPRVLGAVEQTTRGLRNDEAVAAAGAGLACPILTVAKSRIKGDFEPRGVAEALWNNLKALTPNTVLRGNCVLLVGYGTIGRALAADARLLGLIPVVYDPDLYKRALARHEGCAAVDTLEAGLQHPNLRLIVGNTGLTSMTARHLDLVPTGVYLASSSSDQVEFDVAHLDHACRSEEVNLGCKRYDFPDGRYLFLLADGYPLNFYAADSVQNQLIDLVMSQILLCACHVARHHGVLPQVIDTELANTLAVDADLVGRFYRAHYQ